MILDFWSFKRRGMMDRMHFEDTWGRGGTAWKEQMVQDQEGGGKKKQRPSIYL